MGELLVEEEDVEEDGVDEDVVEEEDEEEDDEELELVDDRLVGLVEEEDEEVGTCEEGKISLGGT